ncbi:MAG: hypothetical protein IPL08_11070 [Saprospiraceae bacterium]|nr:hypothetical protein [Saprospiraceae bacterium]
MMTEDKLDNKIPVHIVTGFLGAGKTTFINEFIKSQPNVRVIVIENEIGKVNIDGALLIDKAEDIMELTGDVFVAISMKNSMICCMILKRGGQNLIYLSSKPPV